MSGQDICETHGGRAKQNRAAGEARVAREAAEKLAAKWAVPIDTDPTDGILNRICAYAGHVVFYRQQVEAIVAEDPNSLVWGVTKETEGDVVVGNGPTATLDKAEGVTREAKPNIWLVLYNEASDRLVKYCAEALKAGVEERKIRMAEQQGAIVADVIRATADSILERLLAAGMHTDLTGVFTAALNEAAPRHLRSIAGGLA